MNREETDDLMRRLRALNTELGIGILLVDHDLALINALCDRIIVLNEGRVIATGRPDEVRRTSAAIEAHIGTSHVAHTPPNRREHMKHLLIATKR